MSQIDEANIHQKMAKALFNEAGEIAADEVYQQMRDALLEIRKRFESQGQNTISRQRVHQIYLGPPDNQRKITSFNREYLLLLQQLCEEQKGNLRNIQADKDVRLKIYDNVERWLKRKIAFVPTVRHIVSNNNGVTIKRSATCKKERQDEVIELIGGVYETYRYNFGTPKVNSIAKELIYLRPKGNNPKSILVDWWYLIDGNKVRSFRGECSIVNDKLWGHTYSADLNGRMRVFQIGIGNWGRLGIESDIKSGILMSTTPDSDAPEPAMCRVLLKKIGDLVSQDDDGFLRHTKDVHQIDLLEDETETGVEFLKDSYLTAIATEQICFLKEDDFEIDGLENAAELISNQSEGPSPLRPVVPALKE